MHNSVIETGVRTLRVVAISCVVNLLLPSIQTGNFTQFRCELRCWCTSIWSCNPLRTASDAQDYRSFFGARWNESFVVRVDFVRIHADRTVVRFVVRIDQSLQHVAYKHLVSNGYLNANIFNRFRLRQTGVVGTTDCCSFATRVDVVPELYDVFRSALAKCRYGRCWIPAIEVSIVTCKVVIDEALFLHAVRRSDADVPLSNAKLIGRTTVSSYLYAPSVVCFDNAEHPSPHRVNYGRYEHRQH